jgi:hypothetical protein
LLAVVVDDATACNFAPFKEKKTHLRPSQGPLLLSLNRKKNVNFPFDVIKWQFEGRRL